MPDARSGAPPDRFVPSTPLMSSFQRDPNFMTQKPRRVRGGVRLSSKTLPLTLGWAGTRWMSVVEACAGETAIREGFDYARAGQTRALTVEPGRLIAGVQGRAIRAYRLTIQVETFTEEQWERAVSALADQAIFSARLLAGEMPPEIESIFQAQGLSLFPRGPQDLALVCSAPNEIPWCKHVCCAALLFAEALQANPGLLLTLRGMPAEEVLERLRDRRSALSPSENPALVAPHHADLDQDRTSPPLESQIEEFWEAGPALETIETPIRPPEVSHPLLRRLGPSPFPDGKFPLVGLLATCYELMSKEAIAGVRRGDDPPADAASS